MAYFRSRASFLFAWLMKNRARHLYDFAVKECGPLPAGATIADIGCGNGVFLAKYLSRYPEVRGLGLDQSAELIRFARKECVDLGERVEFLVCDIHESDLPPAGFDLIFSGSSIYCWRDPALALDKLFEALKPGGRLLLYDELPGRSLDQALQALFVQKLYGLGLPAYTEDELREFIARSRFAEAEISVDRLIVRLEMFRPSDSARPT